MSNKYKDFIGTEIGDFVVIECLGTNDSKHKLYLCECKNCGAVITGTAHALLNGYRNTKCRVCGGLNNNKNVVVTDEVEETKNETDEIEEDIECEDYENEERYPYLNPYDDSYDLDPSINGLLLFNGARGYEKNSGDVAEGIYKAYPISDELSVCFREAKVDMFTLPRYYYVAHCIPYDLSCYGNTAQLFDTFYNLAYNLEFFAKIGERKVGKALMYSNVITMFPNHKGKVRPQYSTLLDCVRYMANMCAEQRVQFLAMPHIGVGGNHIKWDWQTVKQDIIDIFIDEYQKAYEVFLDENDDNYRPANIYITFCDYPIPNTDNAVNTTEEN